MKNLTLNKARMTTNKHTQCVIHMLYVCWTCTRTQWQPSDKLNNSAAHYTRRQSLTVLTSHEQSHGLCDCPHTLEWQKPRECGIMPRVWRCVFTETWYCDGNLFRWANKKKKRQMSGIEVRAEYVCAVSRKAKYSLLWIYCKWTSNIGSLCSECFCGQKKKAHTHLISRFKKTHS